MPAPSTAGLMPPRVGPGDVGLAPLFIASAAGVGGVWLWTPAFAVVAIALVVGVGMRSSRRAKRDT